MTGFEADIPETCSGSLLFPARSVKPALKSGAG
jgi:hypothetical protein